jgi:TRAP-type transport system small permease protein|uniref:TRAP transporter small permease n=1 Tax=Orrella sp. TaxID=1921583 RepID=UPI004047DBB3
MFSERMPADSGKLRVFFDRLETALKFGAVLLALLMLGALALQVFMRYVFGQALSWSEELTLLWFAWLIVFTSAVGFRRMTHARMSLLLDLLPAAARRFAERLIAVLVLLLSAYLTFGAWHYFSETIDSVSPAIGYPVGFLYGAVLVFGILMAVFSVERILTAGQGLDE